MTEKTDKRPYWLFVEGSDDKHFFIQLLAKLNLNQFHVEEVKGKDKFEAQLQARIDSDAFTYIKGLAFVRDSDDNPDGTFQSICDMLKRVNSKQNTQKQGLEFPIPAEPLRVAQGNPLVGICIMPPDKHLGKQLEDLCLAAIENMPHMTCVDEFMKCITSANLAPSDIAKARLHAYLAIQEEPGKPIGISVQSNYIPWQSPVFAPLIAFLQDLAQPQSP